MALHPTDVSWGPELRPEVFAHFEAMNRAIVASRTQPVGDQIYAFDKAWEAFKCTEKGAHFGKMVIRIIA